MNNFPEGVFFSHSLQQQIKELFFYVDHDPDIGKRLYFDNAGGSFRLKKAIEHFKEIDMIPDCPERIHQMALKLIAIQDQCFSDIRMMLNAKDGSILTTLTASQGIHEIIRTFAENIPGTNVVTSILEHPSAFDAAEYYSSKFGKELRVAKSNIETGCVDVDEIIKLIDKNTAFLNVMYASNISGAIFELEEIIQKARAIKPDLFIVVDAVQHAPHGLIDLQKTPVDAINFAPYKYFGCRGVGIAWLSDRASTLPHPKLLAKPNNEWELGSPAPSHFAAISEVFNYVCWIGSQFSHENDKRELFSCGMNQIALHERALLSRLLNGSDEVQGLRQLPNVKVFLDYKDLSKRDLIIAIEIAKMDYVEAVREYEKRKVIVYERVNTSPYSKRMIESFGMRGAVRISPIHCHDQNDIDQFLLITKEISELKTQ